MNKNMKECVASLSKSDADLFDDIEEASEQPLTAISLNSIDFS